MLLAAPSWLSPVSRRTRQARAAAAASAERFDHDQSAGPDRYARDLGKSPCERGHEREEPEGPARLRACVPVCWRWPRTSPASQPSSPWCTLAADCADRRPSTRSSRATPERREHDSLATSHGAAAVRTPQRAPSMGHRSDGRPRSHGTRRRSRTLSRASSRSEGLRWPTRRRHWRYRHAEDRHENPGGCPCSSWR